MLLHIWPNKSNFRSKKMGTRFQKVGDNDSTMRLSKSGRGVAGRKGKRETEKGMRTHMQFGHIRKFRTRCLELL